MPTSLAIVIVNYNSWQGLTKLLTSVLQQKLDRDYLKTIQIIVVDNHSSQPKPDFTGLNESLKDQSINIEWLFNKNNAGFAVGCNLGAARVATEFVLFCNPDIEIPPNGIQDLLTSHQNNAVNLLAPHQVNNHGKTQSIAGRFPGVMRFMPLLGGFFKQPKGDMQGDTLFYCDWISGAVILMKHRDFKALGGWDEAFFMFMEDVDLCRRARHMGFTVAVTAKTTWLHHHGISSRYHIADRVRSKRAGLAAKHIYISKHLTPWQKYLAHGFVVFKYLPELALGWLLSWPIPKPVFVSRRLILNGYVKDLKRGFKFHPKA